MVKNPLNLHKICGEQECFAGSLAKLELIIYRYHFDI